MRSLRHLLWLAPVAGLGLLGWLGWALATQLDYWSARSFALLVYGAALLAVISSAAAARLRRRASRMVSVTRWPRRLLWTGVLACLLWSIWPESRGPVGYAFRQLSLLRFR